MANKKNTFDTEKAFKSIIGIPTAEPTEPNETQQATSVVSVGDSTPKTVDNTYKQRGRKKLTSREKKKRYSFTILPSVYENAQKKAMEEGHTLSELVSDFLKKYAK